MHHSTSPDNSEKSIGELIEASAPTAPRITPADLQANIVSAHYFTAAQGDQQAQEDAHEGCSAVLNTLQLLTLCVLVLKNGFTVTGESACASPENFNAEIGRKIARQNAEQKLWPLMGYALKQELFNKA